MRQYSQLNALSKGLLLLRQCWLIAACLLFTILPDSRAQLFGGKFRKKAPEVSEPGTTSPENSSNSSARNEAAKKLAIFPGAFRRLNKERGSADAPATSDPQTEGDTTPQTSGPEQTTRDPEKMALEALVLSAIPADRHYRESLADAVATAYWKNGFKPLWKGKRLPDRLFRSIGVNLEKHALPMAKALDPDTIQAALPNRPPVDRKDLAKTIAIADAGAFIRFGAVPAESLWPVWDAGDIPGSVDRSAAALADDLIRGSRTQPFSLEAAISSMAPRSWIYRELQKGYAQSRKDILQYTGLPNIPNPKDYGAARPGQAYPQAPALAAHLIHKGYLKMDPGEAATLSQMTPALTEGLIAFQRDYGLEADGILGPSTWANLNTNPADQFRRRTINLHRARLVPYHLGDRYVIVNLPTAELFGFEKGDHYSLNMRIVHGKASKDTHRTPIFRDVMQEIVFGPYWNVPKDIGAGELVPKARDDADFLDRNNYEIVQSFRPSAKPFEINDENLSRVEAGSLFLRQKPGSNNALGTVKFLLPNKYNIYLHDTPSKQYFARSQRDQSHGCIRLADPRKMANWVLSAQGWDENKVKGAFDADRRSGHRVENGLNVYITYFTCFPRPKGGGNYILAPARDVYTLDGKDSSTLGSVIPWNKQAAVN